MNKKLDGDLVTRNDKKIKWQSWYVQSRDPMRDCFSLAQRMRVEKHLHIK